MNKDSSISSRPTFKRTLRRISITSVVITMMLAWLLLSVTSMLTLKQYAQKNLELLSATVSHSLEAAVVFHDSAAAHETLAVLGKQGQFTEAQVLDTNGNEIAHWQINSDAEHDMVGGLVSKWLYPRPIEQHIWHNGKVVGEMHLTGTDTTITHFVWLSLGVLTACILLASIIAICISRYLHGGMEQALQNITDVVHDVRTNRNFSRRVPPEKIEEFYVFSQDFNSLLDEMEDWHHQLQQKNASLQKSALHDPLTGLANRASFRATLDKLLLEEHSDTGSALLFMDGDNFKSINDTWGHAAGDLVLIEVANRLMLFTSERLLAFRLGGDEFAMIIHDISQRNQLDILLKQLKAAIEQPICLQDGQKTSMTLSVGVALTNDTFSVEDLMETADRNMYIEKHKLRQLVINDN